MRSRKTTAVAGFTVTSELFFTKFLLGDARNEKNQSSCNEPCLRGGANGSFLRSPGQYSGGRGKSEVVLWEEP